MRSVAAKTESAGKRPPAFVITAPASGGGKTTVTVGLLRALSDRGLKVQSFKVGTDFVDPLCHAAATGRPALNLDLWTMGEKYVRSLFDAYAMQADAVVIEGVMGLFDGGSGRGVPGSTAALAKRLNVPVVLVVDASASAESVAAVALGFQKYDAAVQLAGVIANRIASEGHSHMVAQGLASIGIPYFGGVSARDELVQPDARGGLIIDGTVQNWIGACGAAVADGVDLDGLLRETTPVAGPEGRTSGQPTDVGTAKEPPAVLPWSPPGSYGGLRLAIARDAAFCFYHKDALAWLKRLGVYLVPFSPLADKGFPDDVDGMYIGGGFLDRFAADLAANEQMRSALRTALTAGIPCYAEAGGFQYLLEELQVGKETYPMVGYLQGRTVIERRLQGIGYRLAQAVQPPKWLADVGPVRGRVFHYGRPEGLAKGGAWQLRRATGEVERVDGIVTDSVLASFLYVHLPTQVRLTKAFLDLCQRFRTKRKR